MNNAKQIFEYWCDNLNKSTDEMNISWKDMIIEKCIVENYDFDNTTNTIKNIKFKPIQTIFSFNKIYSFIDKYIPELFEYKILNLINRLKEFYVISSHKWKSNEFIVLDDDELQDWLFWVFNGVKLYE